MGVNLVECGLKVRCNFDVFFHFKRLFGEGDFFAFALTNQAFRRNIARDLVT